jgi:hypothetical protein
MCDGRGGRYTAIARGHGRTLVIVYQPIPGRPGFVGLVTARVASRTEKRLLRKRGKGR